MEKYTGHKKNYVKSFFTRCKEVEQRRKNLEEQYDFAKNELSLMRRQGCSPQELSQMQEQIFTIQSKLNRSQKQCHKKNIMVAKLAAILGVSLTLASSIVAVGVNAHTSRDFYDNCIDGYSYTQENENENLEASYLQFKYDLNDFVKLSNKESLSTEEKEQLANIKERIQSSPKEITTYSLEVLKTRIADTLNINDFNRITIWDKSTDISADRYHSQNGHMQDVSISIDGEEKFSCKKFTSLSTGETQVYSDTIPKDILESINQIVTSQRDPENAKLARNALESTLRLDIKDLTLDENETDR